MSEPALLSKRQQTNRVTLLSVVIEMDDSHVVTFCIGEWACSCLWPNCIHIQTAQKLFDHIPQETQAI